jgi:hypothetical protein
MSPKVLSVKHRECMCDRTLSFDHLYFPFHACHMAFRTADIMISGVLKFLDASTPREYNIPRIITAAALDGSGTFKGTRLLAIVNPSGVARQNYIGIFSMNMTSIARTCCC